MIRNRLVLAMYVALMALILNSETVAQQTESHYSCKALRRLIKTAKTPEDFRVLAEYFHQQKQIYRAKADDEMKEYAKYFSFYHPKILTTADEAARSYLYYSGKADHAATRASYYDDLLVRNGFKPTYERLTVSAADHSGDGAITHCQKQRHRTIFLKRLGLTSGTVPLSYAKIRSACPEIEMEISDLLWCRFGGKRTRRETLISLGAVQRGNVRTTKAAATI